ncbi:MAG: sugar phosphate isomerase/epimerase family protein, partial [Pirellulales bacterium]
MQYGICNETFGNWPLRRVCEFAADSGYTGIEIAPFTLGENPHELSSNQRGDLRRIIAQAGLECIGLHWLLAKTVGLHVTSPDADTRSRTISYLTDLARLCRDLGGKTLVFGSPQQRSLMADMTEQDAHLFLQEVFGALVPALEETDTVLALEPLAPIETNVLTTADETRHLIDSIGSPHIRLHLDVKAMASEDLSIPEIIHASAAHLEHFHANDI